MSLINISNLTFCYDGSYDNIFTNTSFQIDTDWKLGLIGRNGRGKTTLLKLLLGSYKYSGTISASTGFDYFPFDVLDPAKTTVEVATDIYPDCELWMLTRELNLLEVSQDCLYRPFNTLSNGEQTKVLLAALFMKENNFLLIDEPTNHLDIEARGIVGDYLRGKKGFILVSHDRSFLDSCVDHIISINKANIDIQKGNFSAWQQNKDYSDSFELEENEKLKKEIKRLEKTAREKAAWSDEAESRKIGFNPKSTEKSIGRRSYEGAKSKKMMKRAAVITERQQSAIDEKSKLLKNLETAESLPIRPLKYHSRRLIEFSCVSVLYGSKTAAKDISFTINSGDRIALCGKNGCGKTSILKLAGGEGISYRGGLYIASGLTISYVPQDSSFLRGNLKDYALDNKIDESLFKAILRKLDFSRLQFEKDMRSFSAGQKKKVLIAASLCRQAHLYIWDEPLNYIDVLSRIQIEELILENSPTMLLVEHDRAFIDKIATEVISM